MQQLLLLTAMASNKQQLFSNYYLAKLGSFASYTSNRQQLLLLTAMASNRQQLFSNYYLAKLGSFASYTSNRQQLFSNGQLFNDLIIRKKNDGFVEI